MLVVLSLTAQYVDAQPLGVEVVGVKVPHRTIPLALSKAFHHTSPFSLTVSGWTSTFVGSDHDAGYDHKPSLATDPYGNLWYVYSSSSGLIDRKDSIHIFCSPDGGLTWNYEGALYTLDSTWGIYEPSVSINPTNGRAYVGFTLGQKGGVADEYSPGTFVVLSYNTGSGCSLTSDTFVAVTPSGFAAKTGVVASDGGNNGYAYAVVMDTSGELGFFSSSDYGASWTYVAYWNSGTSFTYNVDGTAKYGASSGAYFAWVEIDDGSDPLPGSPGYRYVMYADWGPPGDTSSLDLWWFGDTTGFDEDANLISVAYLPPVYALAVSRCPSLPLLMNRGIDDTVWTSGSVGSVIFPRHCAVDVAVLSDLLGPRLLMASLYDTYHPRVSLLVSASSSTGSWSSWPGASRDVTDTNVVSFSTNTLSRYVVSVVVQDGEPKIAYRRTASANGGGDAWFARLSTTTKASEGLSSESTPTLYDVLGRRRDWGNLKRGIYFLKSGGKVRKVVIK